MKFTLFTIFAAVLAPFVVFAAPPSPTSPTSVLPKPTSLPVPPSAPGKPGKFDGISKCQFQGKFNRIRMIRCCTQNKGKSQVLGTIFRCRVHISREGYYRKCVYDVSKAAAVRCLY